MIQNLRPRWDILQGMRTMIDGYVGEWAKEAKAHIDKMEAMILDSDAFYAAYHEWKTKLLPQCPESLWTGMRKGNVQVATL
jgi:hypothetical protein